MRNDWMTMTAKQNSLYYGDNLAVLRESIPTESVDLIYPRPAIQLECLLQRVVGGAAVIGRMSSPREARGRDFIGMPRCDGIPPCSWVKADPVLWRRSSDGFVRSWGKLTYERGRGIRLLTLNRHKREYFAAMHSALMR
jgi:hypothetical protein